MSEVTKIVNSIDSDEPTAAAELLPLVYHELRSLARDRLAKEPNTPSLQPTLLVHDAFLRLVDVPNPQNWDGRKHFFSAAAEAMRRILIEHARRKRTRKHGGNKKRIALHSSIVTAKTAHCDVIDLNECLMIFEANWPVHANILKLRFFAGLSIAETSKTLGMSSATTERYWTFAKAWLYSKLDNTLSLTP